MYNHQGLPLNTKIETLTFTELGLDKKYNFADSENSAVIVKAFIFEVFSSYLILKPLS